jgi:protein-tyrosine phosphatase
MLNGVYRNTRAAILSRTLELNAALRSAPDFPHSTLDSSNSELDSLHSESRIPHSALDSSRSELGSPPSTLTILPGADVHLAQDLFYPVSRLVTVGDGGKYLLVEFPSQVIPPMAERILFRLIGQGVVPIITHPERNLEIGRKPARYYEMVRMGCLGQVTAMSLTGGFGPEARRLAEALLIRRLVHVIASDAHSTDLRPPVLTPAVTAAAKLVGATEAARMVIEYPQAVLDGEKLDLPPPIPI